jgi:hypothetical protein
MEYLIENLPPLSKMTFPQLFNWRKLRPSARDGRRSLRKSMALTTLPFLALPRWQMIQIYVIVGPSHITESCTSHQPALNERPSNQVDSVCLSAKKN